MLDLFEDMFTTGVLLSILPLLIFMYRVRTKRDKKPL
jgi:hypothetical protein